MIHTDLCDVLGITHPIVQAGMARHGTSAGLVAAVSEAGGLGTLGCLSRPAGEAVAEIRAIRARTGKPFSVNFVLHRLDEETFSACLAERVPVFTFFRGDPATSTAIARARDSGAKTIYQATTVEEAIGACRAGVDVLIAQGMEAGGHMGPAAMTTIVPAVVAVAGGRPVLAAGGIVDGRGLATALCLGASGVLMGTRFLATPEAPIDARDKNAILGAAPGSTLASEMFDLIWGEEWPGVQARGLRNNLTARWQGREKELREVRAGALSDLQRAEQEGNTAEMIVLAGEGAGLIDSLLPAAQVVQGTVAEAARILSDWGSRVTPPVSD